MKKRELGEIMRIYMGADHGGFNLKEELKEKLIKLKEEMEIDLEVEDLGTDNEESCDFPDFAEKVCKKVIEDEGSRGILVCGTGIGMCMAANKFQGIRAALVTDEYSAKMSRQHNNSNVLCLGGRTTDSGLAFSIVKIWLTEPYQGDLPEGKKYERRNKKIREFEIKAGL